MKGDDRPWERWDDEGIAHAIDGYWIGDATSYERAIRRAYAKLVQQYVGSPEGLLLEVGCGSGLVYAELVPNVIANVSYTGVDTSAAMLAIAHSRHPEGRFLKGDAYDLSFRPRSMDLVVCFEVLVHLPDILQPISEMLRVSSRCLIFTVWLSTTGRTERGTDTLNGREFIRNLYSVEDVLQAIDEAGAGSTLTQEIRVVAPSTWAFVVQREGRTRRAPPRAAPRIRPFPGVVEELRQELAERAKGIEVLTENLGAKQSELEETRQEAAAMAGRIESLEAGLAAQLRDREERMRELAARATRIESLAGDLASLKADLADLRSQALELALKHDEMRDRRLVRLVRRFRPQDDPVLPLPPSFDRLWEEKSHLGGGAGRFRLQYSPSLLRVCALQYRLTSSKTGLRGLWLAAIPDIPATSGTIVVELATSTHQVLASTEKSIGGIDATSPTRFAFPNLAVAPAGAFILRVFVRGANSPIRLLEWRRYRLGGLGPVETRAFCAYDGEP